MLNQRLAVALAVVVAVSSVAGAASAAQGPSSIQSTRTAAQQGNLAQLVPAPRSSPFERVFVLPGEFTSRVTLPAPRAVSGEKPRVVCGLTVVPFDPRIDSKMRVEPKVRNMRFTIQTVAPPICR